MIELLAKAMTCEHCVASVTRTVKPVDPGASVDADLATKRVRGRATPQSPDARRVLLCRKVRRMALAGAAEFDQYQKGCGAGRLHCSHEGPLHADKVCADARDAHAQMVRADGGSRAVRLPAAACVVLARAVSRRRTPDGLGSAGVVGRGREHGRVARDAWVDRVLHESEHRGRGSAADALCAAAGSAGIRAPGAKCRSVGPERPARLASGRRAPACAFLPRAQRAPADLASRRARRAPLSNPSTKRASAACRRERVRKVSRIHR